MYLAVSRRISTLPGCSQRKPVDGEIIATYLKVGRNLSSNGVNTFCGRWERTSSVNALGDPLALLLAVVS